MGDGAERWDENGEQAWFEHLAGQCDGFCVYCAEEYNETNERTTNRTKTSDPKPRTNPAKHHRVERQPRTARQPKA